LRSFRRGSRIWKIGSFGVLKKPESRNRGFRLSFNVIKIERIFNMSYLIQTQTTIRSRERGPERGERKREREGGGGERGRERRREREREYDERERQRVRDK
jgi:hypothetical protein